MSVASNSEDRTPSSGGESQVPAQDVVSQEERDWLRERLHSPLMQCRQCEVTRRLLDSVES